MSEAEPNSLLDIGDGFIEVHTLVAFLHATGVETAKVIDFDYVLRIDWVKIAISCAHLRNKKITGNSIGMKSVLVIKRIIYRWIKMEPNTA